MNSIRPFARTELRPVPALLDHGIGEGAECGQRPGELTMLGNRWQCAHNSVERK